MPVICAVNGQIVGGACGLVLACDLVIAAEDAVFDFAFARIGLVPDCGLAWLLPQIVGRNRARHMLMGGRHVGAEQALAIGMVERVVSRDALASTAMAAAKGFAASPAFALGLTKRLRTLTFEAAAQDRAGKSDDFKALLASMDVRRTS
jgi:2-(1,2-epoxy-1,2-dihydrophenyl)acetyl-CoA isomerase